LSKNTGKANSLYSFISRAFALSLRYYPNASGSGLAGVAIGFIVAAANGVVLLRTGNSEVVILHTIAKYVFLFPFAAQQGEGG